MTRTVWLILLPLLLATACILDWRGGWSEADADAGQRDRGLERDATAPEGPVSDGPPSPVTGQFVSLPPGEFMMGSPTDEPCRLSSESQHKVRLTRRFEIYSTEVTRGEFGSRLGYDPTDSHCGADACPVSSVSWHEAAAYCNALSAESGKTACYTCTGSRGAVCKPAFTGQAIYDCPGYRLPTEAEWEYAYRAGSSSAFYTGGFASGSSGCEEDGAATALGWYKHNSPGQSVRVGLKPPNAWMLYDMAGNVSEWCHDGYLEDLGSASSKDPWGDPVPDTRVHRGGSFQDAARTLRAAWRTSLSPTIGVAAVGFRCVRTAPVAHQGVVQRIVLPTSAESYAVDLDGHGAKNALGAIFGFLSSLPGIASFQTDLDAQFAAGAVLLLVEVYAESVVHTSQALLLLETGAAPRSSPKILTPALTVAGPQAPYGEAKGTVRDGKIKVGPATLFLPFPLPGSSHVTLPLRLALVEGKVSASKLDAVLAGALTGPDLDASVLPQIAARFTVLIGPNSPLTEGSKSSLRAILDTDGDGLISVTELRAVMVLFGIKPDIDTDGDKVLDGFTVGVELITTHCKIVR